ncbi:MAG: diguanylate cyclase [Lachnospiraceae bacterium]|nr:diguanylate cyclase [Lachnospiraceae bacterium]
MHSIRTKFTFMVVSVIIITLSIATAIGVTSIKKLGREDADQMMHLTATTGAMNLELYFESVEHSVRTVSTLVSDSFEGMPFEDLNSQVERARNLYGRIAYNTNGVLTYYFRIDPEISEDVTGFWYVYQDGEFKEHEVTDITQYDTNDTSALVWFTVPKATGEGVWLPPYYTENLGTRVISYNEPVYWKNRFVGVIGIEIDYEMLKQEVENISIFKSGYAFILDEDSNVFYHPLLDSAKLVLETTAIYEPAQFIGSNHIWYTYEGVAKEAVWIPLSNGMQLYVCAPVSEINSGWKGMIGNVLIALLIILAISITAMMRFTGRITKPLGDLTEAAKQVDEGNYDFSLEYDKDDEIGILTRTFKQLAANTEVKITKARRMADIDPMTGIKNKHAYAQWEEKINGRIKEGEQEPFAVVVCDINNLKVVNDLYGHKEGDACIKNACARICGVFSRSPVFRVGGDEFIAILTKGDYIQRKKLLERINALPRDLSKFRKGETVSAGMAEYDKDKHPSLLSVVEEADKAMYERKQYLKKTISPDISDADRIQDAEYIPVIHTRKNILIADDVEMNRESMRELLADDYNIIYAADGVEVLNVLRRHKDEVDLVLLDLQMPNKSGREVIAEMQVDEELMDIPVIFLNVDQDSELDCLKTGAMDFLPNPYPDVDIIKARIAKSIELAEDRALIRYTERDKLTGLLNKDYFFRYVNRLDHLFKDTALDAVVCDVNKFHSANKQYGRQFGDHVLRDIGAYMNKLARETSGISCRESGDTFLLYCQHQDDYETILKEFLSDLYAEEKIADNINVRFGVFANAGQEPDMEERFERARIAAEKVRNDPEKICGYYTI